SRSGSRTITHSKPYVSFFRSSFDPNPDATPSRSCSTSWSTCVNSPAESGLKTTAPAPAGFRPHSTSRVTAAVVRANRRSPAGSLSFARPDRMSRRPTYLLLRGLALARLDLLRRLAGSDLGLQLRELVVDLARRGDLRELAVELRAVVGEVLEGSRCGQLVDRRSAGLQLLGLVLGALDGESRVLHASPDPGGGLADLHLCLGGRVLRLDDLLLRPEGLDAALELLLRGDELVLLVAELLHLLVEALQLRLRGRLALERLAREVLASGRDGLARLRLELHDVLLDLLRLDLEPLLRGHDVGDAPLDVLELLEHL